MPFIIMRGRRPPVSGSKASPLKSIPGGYFWDVWNLTPLVNLRGGILFGRPKSIPWILLVLRGGILSAWSEIEFKVRSMASMIIGIILRISNFA